MIGRRERNVEKRTVFGEQTGVAISFDVEDSTDNVFLEIVPIFKLYEVV